MAKKQETVKLGDYHIINKNKWTRAILGTVGRGGRLSGGVGEDATEMEKLAAYDKLGGLIRKGGNPIKIGSFYDFKEKKARTEPKITFLFRDLEGNEVEIGEKEKKPVEVEAAEMIREKRRVKDEKKLKEKKEEKEKRGTSKTKKDDE